MVKYIVFLFPLNGDYGTDSEEPFTGAVLLLPLGSGSGRACGGGILLTEIR